MKTRFNKTSTLVLALTLLLSPQLLIAANSFQQSANGALYKDLKPGSGEVAAFGDTVTIHFTGWFDSNGARGKEIYNTRRESRTVAFVVGTDRVMPGWNEAVIGMHAGGKRLVKVPASLAYGTRGVQGIIPPDTGLIFVIELIQLEKSDVR